MLKEMGASLASAVVAMLLLIALVYWVLWGPVLQVLAWAWVVDLFHPSFMPIVFSVWYWLLPVCSTGVWLVVTMRCLIEGVDVYKKWGLFNLLLWSPLWFVPTVALVLSILAFLAWVNIWRWHNE